MDKKNKQIQEKYKVELSVLKNFLKHIKHRNLYIIFRMAVNHGNFIDNDIIHTFLRINRPKYYTTMADRIYNGHHDYINAKSINDILAIMHKQLSSWDSLEVKNTKEFQMTIMHLVNSLLHNCIEYGVRDNMKILEEVGAQIFEDSCKELLGESFEDLTQEDMPKLDARDFMKTIKMGLESWKEFVDWKEFVERFARYYENNNDGIQMLDNNSYGSRPTPFVTYLDSWTTN